MKDESREPEMIEDGTEEELLKHFLQTQAREQVRRSWRCLDENTLAAFSESTLPAADTARVRNHLSKCDPCMQQVAFLLKTQGLSEHPEVPRDLLRQAEGLQPDRPSRKWSLAYGVPLGALAAAVTLAVLLWTPWTDTGPGSVPLEKVRGPESESFAVLSPSAGSVVTSLPLDIQWEPLEGSYSYEVRITSLAGELVWQQDTEQAVTSLQSRPGLEPGEYYLYVRALLPERRVIRSAPVRFRLANQDIIQ